MRYTYYSETGGRDVNEDTVSVVLIDHGFCALVADGLGGQGNGDVASKTAVSSIVRAFESEPSCDPGMIQSYFVRANNEVIKLNGGRLHTMTTMVGLFCTEQGLAFAHVGDSRLYHFYNGRIAERTIDHSVTQMAVALGEITDDQIRNHPDRNRILRAIGGEEEIEVEIHPVSLYNGFHAFLLCSDGFWEYVLEPEMEIDLAKSETPEEWIELMCRRRSLRAPSDADNHSAVVIFLG